MSTNTIYTVETYFTQLHNYDPFFIKNEIHKHIHLTLYLRTSYSMNIHTRSSCCLTSVKPSSSSIPRSSLVDRFMAKRMEPSTLDRADLPSRSNHLSNPVDGTSLNKENYTHYIFILFNVGGKLYGKLVMDITALA